MPGRYCNTGPAVNTFDGYEGSSHRQQHWLWVDRRILYGDVLFFKKDGCIQTVHSGSKGLEIPRRVISQRPDKRIK